MYIDCALLLAFLAWAPGGPQAVAIADTWTTPTEPLRIIVNQRAFAVLTSLPCDVFLAAHASAYDGPAKMTKARAGAKPNPFIDPQGYTQAIARSERTFLAELEKQSGR